MKISGIAYLAFLLLIMNMFTPSYVYASKNIYYLEVETIELGYNNYVVYGNYYMSPMSLMREKLGFKGSISYSFEVLKKCEILSSKGDKTYFTCNVLGENVVFFTSKPIYSDYVNVWILYVKFSELADEVIVVIRLINDSNKIFEETYDLISRVHEALFNDLKDRFGRKVEIQYSIGWSWFGGPVITLLNVFDENELREVFEIARKYIPEEYPLIIHITHYIEFYTPPEEPEIVKGISLFPLNDVYRYLVAAVLTISLTYLYISLRRM